MKRWGSSTEIAGKVTVVRLHDRFLHVSILVHVTPDCCLSYAYTTYLVFAEVLTRYTHKLSYLICLGCTIRERNDPRFFNSSWYSF